MDGREFWNRVYRILDETGMTITDLSKQLGLSRGAISIKSIVIFIQR